MSFTSNKFVTEGEIEEIRKKRQEEWEKVRKPEDPVEAPKEEYESRSLFERLQEQKYKKDAEYEEAHKLKNLMKGLDDDEFAFLELVDKTKMDQETLRQMEEDKELEQYRKAVSSLSQEVSENKLKELKKTVSNLTSTTQSTKKSQKDLLSAAIKRKRPPSASPEGEKKPKLETITSAPVEESKSSNGKEQSPTSKDPPQSAVKSKYIIPSAFINGPSYPSSFKCLGVLPGLGDYTDSTSDDNSSSDDDDFELSISDRAAAGQVKQCNQ